MAKSKKIVNKKQSSAESVQQSAPSDQDGTIGYTIGQWAGHPQYKCKECAFDTLELDAMLEHLLTVHSVIALDGPQTFPPSTQASEPGEDQERADGIFEIDLKEDQ